jgi:hypothetical protein
LAADILRFLPHIIHPSDRRLSITLAQEASTNYAQMAVGYGRIPVNPAGYSGVMQFWSRPPQIIPAARDHDNSDLAAAEP